MAGDPLPSVPSAHERLHQHGARVLSDAELLTILLGPCNSSSSVRDAAQHLLDTLPLSEIAWASPEELMQRQGIGSARAAAITAAFELGRRGAWSHPRRGEILNDPGRVYDLMRHMAHADREAFAIVCLDVRARLIKAVTISEGSLTQRPVVPRDVMREALRAGSQSVIFVHNHPSGSPEPSLEDQDLTARLRAPSELIGLVPRDHIIVATSGYFSFVEAGRWRS
jgi:DNA repair protein RadC